MQKDGGQETEQEDIGVEVEEKRGSYCFFLKKRKKEKEDEEEREEERRKGRKDRGKEEIRKDRRRRKRRQRTGNCKPSKFASKHRHQAGCGGIHL